MSHTLKSLGFTIEYPSATLVNDYLDMVSQIKLYENVQEIPDNYIYDCMRNCIVDFITLYGVKGAFEALETMPVTTFSLKTNDEEDLVVVGWETPTIETLLDGFETLSTKEQYNLCFRWFVAAGYSIYIGEENHRNVIEMLDHPLVEYFLDYVDVVMENIDPKPLLS